MLSTASGSEVKRGKAFLFMTFGAMLIIANLLLVQQNKQLKVSASVPDRSLELKPGEQLPPLRGLDLNGNSMRFDYSADGMKTLLMVFSPGCRACKENMPAWKAVIKQMGRENYRMIAVSLAPEGAKDYVSQYGLADIPVIAEIDPRDRVAYNLMLTPQTILINPDGTVEKVWTGLIDSRTQGDVERTLNVKLSATK